MITGLTLKNSIISGANNLSNRRAKVDELNVFPVPDGDTGTNMGMTIGAARTELLNLPDDCTVEKAAQVTASAMLRGARGNSGVISSLLFRGFSKALQGKKTADAKDLVQALEKGVEGAYKAVMKPTEGTMLTVARVASEEAAASGIADAVELWQLVCTAAQRALDNTPEQLPVLKKAGVVDAGGKGFLVILKGMLAALRGEAMPTLETEHAARDKADFASVGDEDITFAFDTVFIVRRIDDRSIEPFREFLNSIGDSLVIGEDDEAFKVHVHTDTPGVALTEAQRYGTLELAKIENMRTQAEDLAAGRKAQSTDDLEEDGHDHAAPAPQPQELKPFGFLAVCAGDGLAAVFADLGADGIVNGGQTMNPSTESILTEVERIAAETVFVLPNNKNIVMAAQQCAGLSEKKVIVIPTATVPQGISAMMAVDPDETDAATIEQAMNAAASAVTTAQITYAARNSEFDGFAIREGDYLALLEGKLFDTDTSIGAVLEKLAAEADSRGAEFVNLFSGSDVSEEDARKAGEQFGRLCPGAEINVVSGGQPVYYYIISME